MKDQFTIILLPAGAPPEVLEADELGAMAQAFRWVGRPVERVETIDRDWLYVDERAILDREPINQVATYLAASLQPGEYIAGRAFVVAQVGGDPFGEQGATPRTAQSVSRAYEALRRVQYLTSLGSPRPRDSGTLDPHMFGATIDVGLPAMDLHERLFGVRLLDALITDSGWVRKHVGAAAAADHAPDRSGQRVAFFDASRYASEAGIDVHVLISESVWNAHAVPSETDVHDGQSIAGRVGDIVQMALTHNAGPGIFPGARAFDVIIRDGGVRRTIRLNAHATDAGDGPVLAIYQPEEASRL